jgi:hypothetical protein
MRGYRDLATDSRAQAVKSPLAQKTLNERLQ